MGFSSSTCLPASKHCMTADSCRSWGSMMSTASKSPPTRASSSVANALAPVRSEKAFALSASISMAAVTLIRGACSRMPARWKRAISPHPRSASVRFEDMANSATCCKRCYRTRVTRPSVGRLFKQGYRSCRTSACGRRSGFHLSAPDSIMESASAARSRQSSSRCQCIALVRCIRARSASPINRYASPRKWLTRGAQGARRYATRK